MSAFTDAYAQLNAAQKQAVDTIEGPLLVIAGPGTGKTQLLGARVANILQKTDTPPHNILCLTFTENGASNMRQRLARFIGPDAYNVTISTYHAFGSDLIARYPEYFAGTRLQNAIDDLSKRQIMMQLVDAMSYKNPLKQTRHHIGDVISTISEIKRGLLTGEDLRIIAAENAAFITAGSKAIHPVFAGMTKMPGSLAKSRPVFEETLAGLTPLAPSTPVSDRFEPLAAVCVAQLQTALEDADATNKSTPLTQWKNKWLAKDAENRFIIGGELENRRIHAMADVLESYEAALAAEGLYDFDDMILRSIKALEENDDFRFTLQERYTYILLDEFQDTNAAQLRLVQLLTDNPVNEGRANILAVGDDDQAIYAFQGAQYSNMLEYYQMFRDTTVINLTENYRSHSDILSTAAAVAGQIESRLQQHFDGMSKMLLASNPKITSSTIERREFQSDIAERAWIAERIRQLIDSGVSPSEIAILSPKHRQIEPLVSYLNAHDVPVRYERRENILDALVVRQLITMSRLLLALDANETALANSLWPQVLSYDFWGIATGDIWRLSWQVADAKQKLSWSQAALESDIEPIKQAAELLLACAGRTATESCEMILDYLIGLSPLPSGLRSPLKDHYMLPEVQLEHPEIFYETLSHLTVLRTRVSEYQDRSDSALMLPDFIRFIGMYEAAEQPMIDTSPYAQQADAVQLMTVFKAKGLEYQHVFLPGCLDDIWGSSTRGNSNNLTLPANLQPIRHAGATDDERLRILFVALTRARNGLYLTSAAHTFSGKPTKRLKYFDEREQDDGSVKALVLPEHAQAVQSEDADAPVTELLELDWRTRHIGGLRDASLASLLSERTENYCFSPTHLTSFVDLQYGGPQQFFFDKLLKFPGTPSPDSQFGIAIHDALEWYQNQLNEHGYAPSTDETIEHFALRLKSRKLTEQRAILELERGQLALSAFLAQRASIFKPGDIAEKDFHSEGVSYGDIRMDGRIDRLEVDPSNRQITIVDYKTGKSYSQWKQEMPLHKHQLQLYAYKLLAAGSRSYREYNVTAGRLEFIESDEGGRIDSLELRFNDDELERVRVLVKAIATHVRELNFPDVSAYPVSLTGMKAFEQDLIDGKI